MDKRGLATIGGNMSSARLLAPPAEHIDAVAQALAEALAIDSSTIQTGLKMPGREVNPDFDREAFVDAFKGPQEYWS